MSNMLERGRSWLAAATLALAGMAIASPALAQESLGPDAAACRAGADGPAALVRVYGFKDRAGNLRIQSYGNDPDEFLAKGAKLRRVELPVTASGDMNVCIALPHPGEFALVLLHDRDGDGHTDFSQDGVGFSRNPHLGLAKPGFDAVAFTARPGVQIVDVVLQYRKGLLSVGPIVAVRK